jgi:hypothetical protein
MSRPASPSASLDENEDLVVNAAISFDDFKRVAIAQITADIAGDHAPFTFPQITLQSPTS